MDHLPSWTIYHPVAASLRFIPPITVTGFINQAYVALVCVLPSIMVAAAAAVG